MPQFTITPCLLGFEVRLKEHNSERILGIMAFGDVLSLLLSNWRIDYTVAVK